MSDAENDPQPQSSSNPASVVAEAAGLTDAEMTGAVRPDSSRRSTEDLHRAIEQWLAARPGLADVTVAEVVVPESNGMSSETVMVTASWAEDDGTTSGPAEHRLVFRMAPDMTTLPIFEDYDLGTQFRVMADVARLTDVPVPDAIWYEDDVSHLGSEFFVMDRRDGDIPADVLPYNLGDSFLFDAPAEDQHRLQTSSVALLAALHRVPDPLVEFDYLAESVGLSVGSGDSAGSSGTNSSDSSISDAVSGAGTPETAAKTSGGGGGGVAGEGTSATGTDDTPTPSAGSTGATGTTSGAGAPSVSGAECLTNHIERMRAHYEYVKRDSRPSPLIDRAFEWLDANMPDPATISDPVLLWGDSRIGNVIYRDFEPVGVLDWEMATIGPREMDVAWMIFMHQFFEDVARQLGIPGMPAFMRRDDVCEQYEQLTGHRPTNMGFYAVLAALQHAIIMTQVARRSIVFGGGAAFRNEELPDDMDELIMHRQLLIDYMA